MQNKIVILGILVIFFMAMVIFHFYREFFITEVVEGIVTSNVEKDNKTTFDETNSIGAAHATQIRKLLKQVKPYGKLSNSDVIAQVVAIGDTQTALTSILESNTSNKDKVGALNTLFGLISNGLERNLLIHYNDFTPSNYNSYSGSYIKNNSKNTFMENQADYNATIVINDQYENIYDSNVTAVNVNSLYLNGQRDKSGAYLQIPNLPSFENDEGGFSGFTVSAWFYPNTVSNNSNNRLFDFGNGMNKQNMVVTYSADGLLGNLQTDMLANRYVQKIPNIMDQWNHYVWSIDANGKWTIYVNNKMISSSKTQLPEMVERKSNFIGYSNWAQNGDDLYNGWIDDFRVYDRPLNADEVTQLYKLASKKVRNIIEGAELPIDIKIPPVPAYVITDGTTSVKSPIDWKQDSQTTATAVITNAPQDVLNGTYIATVSSSLNLEDSQEWVSSCFNGIYTNPQAKNFGGNFYTWVSNKFSYYKTTTPYGYINSTSETFTTVVSRKSYKGEWVQLKLPSKIVIKSYYLHYPEANIGGIMGAVLAGSLDGNSWKLLHTLTNENTPVPKSIGYYSFNTNTVAYSYYRFIITHANVTDSLVGINELILST